MNDGSRNRIRFVAAIMALLSCSVGARVAFVQIARGEEYREAVWNQHISGAGAATFDRGSIYFSRANKDLIAAASISSGYLVAINPKLIKDPVKTFALISPYIKLSAEDFSNKANRTDDPYEEIEHKLTSENAKAIRALKLPGVILVKEQWRNYPGGMLAAHILGFVGYDKGEYTGRYGIEREYESMLKRDFGSPYNNFFSDLLFGERNNNFDSTRSRAADVVLTIEPSVQTLVESQLFEIKSKWQARSAGAIVMDPKTGDIKAMASIPNFDPNYFSKEASSGVYSNSLIESVYEMGSIMKPITIAAAIDAGKISADTKYFDKGFIELNGKRIDNYDGKGRGLASMQDVLNQSLNTGAAFAALKLGKDSFGSYLSHFGFREPTDIDLPNERVNLLENLDFGLDVDLATASFGQGIAVSPISMTRALGALGNGGFLIKPHVAKSLRYETGSDEDAKPTEQGRAISGATSDEITRMLVKVVDEYLLGGKIKMEHYSIAGKTGTAQIPNPADGGYYSDRYLHTFFGYFPAYEPRFIIFLYLNEPMGVKYASETLTIPFRDITNFLINYYNIAPDR